MKGTNRNKTASQMSGQPCGTDEEATDEEATNEEATDEEAKRC